MVACDIWLRLGLNDGCLDPTKIFDGLGGVPTHQCTVDGRSMLSASLAKTLMVSAISLRAKPTLSRRAHQMGAGYSLLAQRINAVLFEDPCEVVAEDVGFILSKSARLKQKTIDSLIDCRLMTQGPG